MLTLYEVQAAALMAAQDMRHDIRSGLPGKTTCLAPCYAAIAYPYVRAQQQVCMLQLITA